VFQNKINNSVLFINSSLKLKCGFMCRFWSHIFTIFDWGTDSSTLKLVQNTARIYISHLNPQIRMLIIQTEPKPAAEVGLQRVQDRIWSLDDDQLICVSALVLSLLRLRSRFLLVTGTRTDFTIIITPFLLLGIRYGKYHLYCVCKTQFTRKTKK